jgi:hypothetical protein
MPVCLEFRNSLSLVAILGDYHCGGRRDRLDSGGFLSWPPRHYSVGALLMLFHFGFGITDRAGIQMIQPHRAFMRHTRLIDISDTQSDRDALIGGCRH